MSALFADDLDEVTNGRSVLITGGTGSFGQQFVRRLLCNNPGPRRLIVFSRDELKQHEMAREFSPDKYLCLRYFVGDVRDRERLYRALHGVDIVVHAAAMKQVPACEYNPLEAIKTNVLGAANLIDAAIDCGVHKVVALSTDKAAAPVNLYGATKLCAEKLFIHANSYAGGRCTRFAVTRYGNVAGSRGSVKPVFLKMQQEGKLLVTDERMTRFWLELPVAVGTVLFAIREMLGGEIFIPKAPSIRIMDLAKEIARECPIEISGIRPGEKLHETLVAEEDARSTVEHDDYFVITPNRHRRGGGTPCKDGFSYSSDNNEKWVNGAGKFVG